MSNVYGIDIGTSNFKMCCKEKDTILNEKNIIAIANKKDLLAFGDEAYEMYEKAPENIDVSFPVKFGVIADIEKREHFMNLLLIQKLKPRIYISLISQLQMQSVQVLM